MSLDSPEPLTRVEHAQRHEETSSARHCHVPERRREELPLRRCAELGDPRVDIVDAFEGECMKQSRRELDEVLTGYVYACVD